jgi:hypothetical protein
MNTQNTKRFARDITTEMDIIDDNNKLREEIYNKNIYIKDLENEISILKGNEYGYKNKIKKLENEVQKYNDSIKNCDKVNIEEEVNKALKEEKKINEKNMEYYRNNNKKQIQEIKELTDKLNNKEKVVIDLGIKSNIPEEDKYERYENITPPPTPDNKNIKKSKFSKIDESINSIEKDLNISAEINKKDRNYSRKSDKNLQINERFPIKIFKGIGNNFVYQLVAAETSLKIKYKHEIACATKNDKDNINVNEILDYIKSQKDISSQEQTRLRRKFIRCYKLYEKYGEKLNTLNFSLYNIGYMTDKEYILWLQYLENVINELPKKCNYIYRKGDRKGQICETFDCQQHKIIH